MVNLNGVLHYELIKTTRRLTFDIIYQMDELKFKGFDDGDYYMFIASNGYQVISRSRMDIQTERIWLLGSADDESSIRSGTMIFTNNAKRDLAYTNINLALREWVMDYLDGNQNKLSDYIGIPNRKAVAWRATGHIAADIVTESEVLAIAHADHFKGKVTPLYE